MKEGAIWLRIPTRTRVERFWIWLAWKLPRPLAYWAAVRVGSEATTKVDYGNRPTPEIQVTEALSAWLKP